MANDLTAILAVLYRAMKTVSRGQRGYVRACYLNASAQGAAVGQTITYPIVPAIALVNTPVGMSATAGSGQTFASGTMTISNSKVAQLPWIAEDELALMNGDSPMLDNVKFQQIMQAFEALSGAIENDLAVAAAAAMSRVTGTAGTLPFNTANDLRDVTRAGQILDENGAPDLDRHIVLSTGAYGNLGNQPSLFHINEYGSDEFIRDGVVSRLPGFNIHKTGKTQRHTAGTGASATTNNAGYAVGATTITLASAGTGTILVGDVITFAGDTNKYVVVTGDADVSNGGTVVLAAPGLKQAIPASATAITVSAAHDVSTALHRNALHLVARPPAAPPVGKDLSTDAELMFDPISGLVFEVRVYPGVRMHQMEIGCAWGVKAVDPVHIAGIIG
jgi:hypothetical protein